jgi:hypothetical protein
MPSMFWFLRQSDECDMPHEVSRSTMTVQHAVAADLVAAEASA